MPLFWISLALLCGILLSSSLFIPILGWSLIALIAIITLLPPIYRHLFSPSSPFQQRIAQVLKIPSPAIYPLIIVFFCVGVVRYQFAQPKVDPSFIAYYNDQASECMIQAVVIEAPDVRDSYTNLRLQTERLQEIDDDLPLPVHGLLLARVASDRTFEYGDRIRLQGYLVTPSENEDFSYRDYLANQGIFSYMAYPITTQLQNGLGNPFYSALYAVRQKGTDLIYSFFPDPEASLISGILLGVESGISDKVQEAFRLTGTSHIIVISGFNITIVAGLFIFIFSRLLGRYKGAILAVVGIMLYTLLVGANAAVVRAAILGMLTLIGHLIGRRQAGVNSLTFTAAVMAMISPTVLWDVSFQLSFAATLGIMLYAEPLTDWFIKTVSRFIPQDKVVKLAGPVSEYFLITLAAQLTTLPLMIYYFKRISLTSLIANPLILPAQPALMVLSGLAVMVGLVIRPVGQLVAWVAWPFAAYTIRVVEWLANIPHGSIALGQVALATLLLFYALLFAITFARDHIKNILVRLAPVVPLAALAITTVLVWRAAFYAPDGRMHVTILDVGTGDAVLIQSPTGREVLINGGSSTIQLSDALGRRMPPFHKNLDWLVVADIDVEDLAGIQANLERFPPVNVLWAGNTFGTRTITDLQGAFESTSVPITRMQAGQRLELGDGAVLSAVSVNNKGAVMFLGWGNFSMLLPMAMDFDAIDQLLHDSTMRNISTLMLAESGYAPLNSPELIDYLHPQLAVLSVANADKTGLPSAETINALEGYNLLRTDQNGWIEITTDGRQMRVEVERR
jgi:competence protein ComEC